MKKIFTFLWIMLSIYNVKATPETDCSQAHSPATYALFHTKKALKADNFDHQKYYAERALEAFQKTKALIESCGCQEALTAIFEGSDNLQRAINPEDWDKGRFYTKKAYADAQNMIGSLELCTSGERQTILSDDDTELLNANEGNTSSKVIERELLDKQQKIKEQQQKLIEEQQKLDAELNAQRKIIEQKEVARQKELQQQIRLKAKAEQALQNFEKSITELSQILDCQDAYKIIYESYVRAEKSLELESLQGTKRFYTEKARAIAKQVLEGLEQCASQK